MKKHNIFIVICACISQVVGIVLYYTGRVQNIHWYIIISALIALVVGLIVNTMRNWVHSILFGIAVFFISCGIGYFGVGVSYGSSYLYTQYQNANQIQNIKTSENYNLLMTYEKYNYYVDSNYEYLYQIKENGLNSEVFVHSILPGPEAEESFSDIWGEFYLVKDQKAFKNLSSTHKLSIAFLVNVSDKDVFLKILNENNELYYTYISPNKPSQMVADLEITYKSFQLGNTTITITNATKIINGVEIDGSAEIEDYKNGSQYLITSNNNEAHASTTVVIDFEGDTSYAKRLQYFVYKDVYQEIELSKDALAALSPDNKDYITVSEYIASLEKSTNGYNYELVVEKHIDSHWIRMYRMCDITLSLDEVPPITIVEVFDGTKYTYAMTDIEINELF